MWMRPENTDSLTKKAPRPTVRLQGIAAEPEPIVSATT
jgi:hypothetical protein